MVGEPLNGIFFAPPAMDVGQRIDAGDRCDTIREESRAIGLTPHEGRAPMACDGREQRIGPIFTAGQIKHDQNIFEMNFVIPRGFACCATGPQSIFVLTADVANFRNPSSESR